MLIVEDGTGRSDANCFVSQADAVAYFGDLGVTNYLTNVESDDQIAAIARGAQYLVNNYRGRWKGYRLKKEQALPWPRIMSAPLQYSDRSPDYIRSVSYMLDEDGFPILSNEVPQAVKNANCEAANLFLTPGIDLTVLPGPAIKAQRAGDTEREYATVFVDRPAGLVNIDRLLGALLISVPNSSFGMMPVVRG